MSLWMCHSARRTGKFVLSAQAARPAQLHHRLRWHLSFAQSCRALRDSRGPLHSFLRGAPVFFPPARPCSRKFSCAVRPTIGTNVLMRRHVDPTPTPLVQIPATCRRECYILHLLSGTGMHCWKSNTFGGSRVQLAMTKKYEN